MNCGGRDFVCYLLGLLASHGVELSNIGKLVPWIGEFITQHAQAIIGLLGFSFGVWKWWRFHDRVLHKRLKTYLAYRDSRLVDARSYAVDALHRPGRERKFAEPLFAVRPLRKVLWRKNWEPLLRFTRLETSVDRQLDKAVKQLANRLEAAEEQLRSLRNQQSSAYFLKGAIASARAGYQRPGALANVLEYRSLDAFRAARQVPGQDSDLALREFEAHQLLRTGHIDEASHRLEVLGQLLDESSSSRARDLSLARVRRMEGILAQAKVIAGGGKGCLAAQDAIGGGNSPPPTSALFLRSKHAPFDDRWDALEQADLRYAAAFVCCNLGFRVLEAGHLAAAETEYRRVRDAVSKGGWRDSSDRKRATELVEAGLKRISLARAATAGQTPSYDEAWLLPPLQPLERPAAGKGDTGGDKAIE